MMLAPLLDVSRGWRVVMDDLSDQSDSDQQLVYDLLRCVVERPVGHYVTWNYSGNPERPIAYRVHLVDHVLPPVPQPITAAWSIHETLWQRGLLEAGPHPDPQSFAFTEEAIEDYVRACPVSAADLHRRFGRFLYEQYRDHEQEPFDVNAVAAQLRVDPTRLSQEIRVLEGLGFIKSRGGFNVGSLDMNTGRTVWALPRRTYVRLTEPAGIQWASGGFRDVADVGTPTVNVTVHVTVQQVMREVEQLDVSPEIKDQLQLILRRVDEERRKDRPNYKPLQDLLDMASKVKDHTPIVVRLLAEHGDAVGKMAHLLPLM